MTDLKCSGTVSSYQIFSAAYWPKSAPFWRKSSTDVGPAANRFSLGLSYGGVGGVVRPEVYGDLGFLI